MAALDDDFFIIEDENNIDNFEILSSEELQKELERADEIMASYLGTSQLEDVNCNSNSSAETKQQQPSLISVYDAGEKFDIAATAVPTVSKPRYVDVLMGTAHYASTHTSESPYTSPLPTQKVYASHTTAATSYASCSPSSSSYAIGTTNGAYATPATASSPYFTTTNSNNNSARSNQSGCSYTTQTRARVPYCFAF